MKTLYLVANWKSNKTIGEAKEWILGIDTLLSAEKIPSSLHIILCAPFTCLPIVKEEIDNRKLPIQLGAQDISPFTKGAYTGEINANMLIGLTDYVLLGHSERRKYFQENEEELLFEVLQSHSANFQTIYCIDKEDSFVPSSVDIIAFEPTEAIGSGNAEDPESANIMCQKISKMNGDKPVLYGGSVTENNVQSFISQSSISGVLVGGASLDPKRFFDMIQKIASL
jgi:triosephosphate isomerase